MTTSTRKFDYNWTAALGFVLILSPMFFVSAALLKYGLDTGVLFDPLDTFLSDPDRLGVFNIVSPIVFLGGLVVALASNLYKVVVLDLRKLNDSLVTTVTVRYRPWNLAVIVLSGLLLTILFGYAFVENLNHA